MNARIVATATLFSAFSGLLTARAADSQLLGLVMPDAKVVAGVNVDQAKASPFGLYILTQMQSGGLQDFVTLTGFDPTRDVHELLAAYNGTPGAKQATGLALGRGNFDPAGLATLAITKGAVTETYKNVTIIEDPKHQYGLAFPDATLAIAGDVANVKAAIDRPATGQVLPGPVSTLVNQWSAAQDAWMVTTVAPTSLLGGVPAGAEAAMIQQIQQVAAGVKFGANVVGTAVLQSDNAQDATNLANTVQFLVNVLQMQTQKNTQMPNLAQAISVGATGSTVKLTVSLPSAQFQQLIQSNTNKAAAATPQIRVRKQ